MVRQRDQRQSLEKLSRRKRTGPAAEGTTAADARLRSRQAAFRLHARPQLPARTDGLSGAGVLQPVA